MRTFFAFIVSNLNYIFVFLRIFVMTSRQPVSEESFLQQQTVDDDEDIDIMDDNFFDEAGTEEPELSNEATADTSNRNMKSLGMLTKRFIKFLQDSPVGLVDINSVSFCGQF